MTLAAGRSEEAVEIHDDDTVAFEPDEAVVGEHSEKLVHALAGASDHRREVALCERRPKADRPIAPVRAPP